MWRLAWIAHALPHDPRHLFDANIFYPHLRTLAYSDAMLFEGIVAAPFLWAGMNPVVVYNLMFFAGIVSSGAGMFVLVRYLTGDIGAALVAAVIFTVAPYRIEHFIHLELQWTVWMPLALWAVHRTFDGGGFRFGALTGLFLWLQIISCVYYGAFLGLIVAVLALLLLAVRPRQARAAIGPLCLGGLLAAVADAAVRPAVSGGDARARPAAGRRGADVQRGMGQLSGRAAPELALGMDGVGLRRQRAPSVSRRRGVPARGDRAGAPAAIRGLDLFRAHGAGGRAVARPQRRVLPMAVRSHVRVSGISRAGALRDPRLLRDVGPRRLRLSVPPARPRRDTGQASFSSPRCWSRSSWSQDPRRSSSPRSRPRSRRSTASCRTVAPSVILELPAENYEPTYMFWSTYHWHWLVNGYSGYTPGDHLDTTTMMRTFPDDESIARLRELGVRYVLVHQALYQPADFADLMGAVARAPRADSQRPLPRLARRRHADRRAAQIDRFSFRIRSFGVTRFLLPRRRERMSKPTHRQWLSVRRIRCLGPMAGVERYSSDGGSPGPDIRAASPSL